ncbi:MAG: chromosome segregation SMC family protein [Gammaproteobacteria bacterium]
MRLSRIKLSGFKTFVDSTSLNFPSNLTGIVGPNGCGKSNIIDAIRWVMGESSARNLRGETMDDVIFSGSSSRSEVSHASIELLFDNSDNKLDSKFAKFSEIMIRREANRDGTSTYFLNNARCRRKDIREVFLGTGLGPRSYAIIEQGMISKIIDSKPEELRTYLEEAAGISKYKEKRRETELRLKHTSENLSRLNDIMREINSSLTKLQKQARDAELYKELKSKEESLKIKITAKKIISFDEKLEDSKKENHTYLVQKEKYKSESTGYVSKVDELRLSRDTEQDRYTKIQSESFHIAAEIARAEKDIEYTQQIETSKKDNINDINTDIEKIQTQIDDLNNKKLLNNDLINKNEVNKKELETKIKNIDKAIKDSSFSLQNWQSNFNTFLTDKLELQKKIELEKSRIESYIENIKNLEKRLDKYNESDDSTENNIQIELLENSESYQKKLINFKVDYERYIKKLPSDATKSLNQMLNNLIDEFKGIVIKIKENNKSVRQQIKDIQNNIKIYKDKIISSEDLLIKFANQNDEYEKHKNYLEKQKIDLKQVHDKLNWQFNESSEELNVKNVQVTTLKTEISSYADNLARSSADIDVLVQKKQELLSNSEKPIELNIKNKLNNFINRKKEKDIQLTKSQDKISYIDNEIRQYEDKIGKLSIKSQSVEKQINDSNIALAEIKTNKLALLENSDFDKDRILQIIKTIDETALDDNEKILSETKNKIDKLGAINLAAIDELKEQEERKTYLDKQFEDLTKSVEILESAIKKIDIETKSKFKDTFDAINKNLSYFFPKIFGGGKSYLELTDNDLLNTGVNIMAKPPGKLVKNLNLLSGGEKAGTGIAFVFSIFRINPAPFCLLDEVDAPLDEANNERFCNVVKEMSETVQFIFITHNKSTMQMADVLSGVTMREAGVSKMVSVNVEDALQMTSEN